MIKRARIRIAIAWRLNANSADGSQTARFISGYETFQQPVNATCGRSPVKKNGRNRTPTTLPM